MKKLPTIKKTVQFTNPAPQDRREVCYATVPFKRGEWDGKRAFVVLDSDGKIIDDAWVYPFGKPYDDGTQRYGALLTRAKVSGYSREQVTIHSAPLTIHEPQWKFSKGLLNSGSNLHFAVLIDNNNAIFRRWSTIESRGMRQVFESTERLGHFVVKLRIYVYNDQDLVKWELSITGSDPSVTDLVYPINKIDLIVTGQQRYINVRGAKSRGVKTVVPYKHFNLMENSSFGDGQRQTWYGELLTVVEDHESIYSMAAAIDSEMWGMSLDWLECDEAFGALGVIPRPPISLPDGGFEAVSQHYLKGRAFMTSPRDPWDDYPEGLTKTPGQTGSQHDFGIMKGWDVLYTGASPLVETYRFLATEEAKRPGHYLEMDGSPVTHSNHPEWVVWDGVTHWHFAVSPDRLGKTDPFAIPFTHDWRGKDKQHFSSNLLYLAALLTGSYQLMDELEHEAEIFLAAHTLPSQLPNWSTNGRGEARGFGRPHLALLHHDTILNRRDVVQRMLDRFHEVVENEWLGATRSPVKNWSKTNDPRVFRNGQDAWVPWNEQLGWIGAAALYNATRNPSVRQLMIDWATTLVKWGWRLTTSSASVGHGVRWYNDGSPIQPHQFFDLDFWIPSPSLNEWGLAVIKFAKDSNALDLDVRQRAMDIWTLIDEERTRNYNPSKPFDTYGEWTAIGAIE